MMETPRQRWWTKAMDALEAAEDDSQPDAYRAAQAGIAIAYLQMVRLTFVQDEVLPQSRWNGPGK